MPPASSALCCAASRRGPTRAAASGAPSRKPLSAPRTAWRGNTSQTRTLRCAPLLTAGYHAVAVETSPDAVNLFEWTPRWPVCLVFGHEVEGVSSTLAAHVETVIRIPMLGQKRSLNVATAAGVVLYELLRRRLYQR